MTKDIDQIIGQEVAGRICTKCGEWKTFEFFNKKSATRLGVYNECRECQKISNKITYDKYGPASRVATIRAARIANPEQRKAWDSKYYQKNKAELQAKAKQYYIDNPDALERRKGTIEAWKKANPEKVKEINSRAAIVAANKVEKRIHSSVSRAMRSGLAKGGKEGKKTFEILGYSREDLMAHLESLFLPGMSWENYGLHGWHIDHVTPKVLFNITTKDDIDFKRCWALSNLQPMWATDNRKKFTKYTKPFQPSLSLSI